jgi:hypothetical protein
MRARISRRKPSDDRYMADPWGRKPFGKRSFDGGAFAQKFPALALLYPY